MVYITFLIYIYLGVLRSQDSSITFLPDLPRCIGEEVEMICYVESSSIMFIDSVATIALNGSTPVLLNTFNAIDILNGIDTSRYTASITDLSISTSRPGIRVNISDYQASDGSVVFGCAGLLSGSIESEILIQGQPQRLATPPSPASLTADFNSTTCSGTVQLAWTPGDTDRDIQMYFLYQNGNEIASLGYVTSYNHPTTLQRDMTYTYSVVAMSCAGNSTHTNATAIYVGSYSLTELSIRYDNTTSELYVDWTLNSNPDSISLNVTYSLALIYTYTLSNSTTYPYSAILTFSQIYTDTEYIYNLTEPVYSNEPVSIEISALLSIIEQCEVLFSGVTLSAEYTSDATPVTAPLSILIILIIILSIICTIALLVCVSVISVLSLLLVLLYRKLQAHKRETAKAALPAHRYEYIDMDKVAEHMSTVKPADPAYYNQPAKDVVPKHRYENVGMDKAEEHMSPVKPADPAYTTMTGPHYSN